MTQIVINIDEPHSEEKTRLIARLNAHPKVKVTNAGGSSSDVDEQVCNCPVVRSCIVWFIIEQMISRHSKAFPKFSGA